VKILRNRWFVLVASALFFYVVWMLYFVINVDHPHWDILIWGLIGVVYGPIYMLPTLVGLHRRNALAIFILNLFLGWTVIGWVAALIWSVLKGDAA
jgi:membrane protease YdiL (CAAX protease family)